MYIQFLAKGKWLIKGCPLSWSINDYVSFSLMQFIRMIQQIISFKKKTQKSHSLMKLIFQIINKEFGKIRLGLWTALIEKKLVCKFSRENDTACFVALSLIYFRWWCVPDPCVTLLHRKLCCDAAEIYNRFSWLRLSSFQHNKSTRKLHVERAVAPTQDHFRTRKSRLGAPGN